jgi:hypothetical protein
MSFELRASRLLGRHSTSPNLFFTSSWCQVSDHSDEKLTEHPYFPFPFLAFRSKVGLLYTAYRWILFCFVFFKSGLTTSFLLECLFHLHLLMCPRDRIYQSAVSYSLFPISYIKLVVMLYKVCSDTISFPTPSFLLLSFKWHLYSLKASSTPL